MAYRYYGFPAPGLPTTEAYSQLYLSSHRRISTQSDADKSTKSVPASTRPAPTAPPATNTQRTTTTATAENLPPPGGDSTGAESAKNIPLVP